MWCYSHVLIKSNMSKEIKYSSNVILMKDCIQANEHKAHDSLVQKWRGGGGGGAGGGAYWHPAFLRIKKHSNDI